MNKQPFYATPLFRAKAKYYAKNAAIIGAVVAMPSLAMAAGTDATSSFDTSEVTGTISKGVKPVGVVAGSSLVMVATIRVWKMIRRAI